MGSETRHGVAQQGRAGRRRWGTVAVAVSLCIAAVAGSASVTAAATPPPGTEMPPGAPFGLKAVADADSVTFTWDATDPVGDPITNYVVTAQVAVYSSTTGNWAFVPLERESGSAKSLVIQIGPKNWTGQWCVHAENLDGTGPDACSSEWVTAGAVAMDCTSTSYPGVLTRRQGLTAVTPGEVTKGSRFTSRISPGWFPVSPVTLGNPVSAVKDLDLVFPTPPNSKVVSAALEGGTGVAASTASVSVVAGKVKYHVAGPIPAGTAVLLPTIVLRLEATGPVGSVISPALGGSSPADPGLAMTIQSTIPIRAACVPTTNPALSMSLVQPPVWAPFPTVDAFTTQQFADFAGRTPTEAERAAWSTALVEGTTSKLALIDRLRRGAYWEPVIGPVARLYSAYFLRLPDTAGLNHWVGKRRAGTGLDSVSQSFAASKEFKTRYGTLSNNAFVLKVYENVLGRTGDAKGIAFWTKELDTGRRTRGAVMTGFSESAEYKGKQADAVTMITVSMGALRRVPTPAEIVQGKGQPAQSVINYALGLPEYAARF